MRSESSRRWAFALLAGASVVVPFTAVRFAPITDLPQHLAQVRLFFDTLAHPAGPYVIQWWTPYLLADAVLTGLWRVLPPLAAGRAVYALAGVLWVAAAAWLAWRGRRSPAVPCFAALAFFNVSLYWGFLPFLFGFPIFAVWFVLTTRPVERFDWREVPVLVGLELLLWVTHVLWFAAALLWLAVLFASGRVPRRVTLLRGLSAAPLAVAALIWFPRLAHGGFSSAVRMDRNPIRRLSPGWIENVLFSGLGGVTPWLVLVVLLAILAGAFARARQAPVELDRNALWIAGLFFACFLFLPFELSNTIFFAGRWLPCAVVFLALALPPPRFVPRGEGVLLACVMLAFVGTTTYAWVRFDRTEMAGLDAALAQIPEHARLLQLDLSPASPIAGTRPFMQVGGYAQALRDAEPDFSFARFANMPVVFRTPPARPWTNALEWFPERLQCGDLAYFDQVLVHGTRDALDKWQVRFPVTAITSSPRWRLYRVDHGSGCAAPVRASGAF